METGAEQFRHLGGGGGGGGGGADDAAAPVKEEAVEEEEVDMVEANLLVALTKVPCEDAGSGKTILHHINQSLNALVKNRQICFK
jgi:hypothetical protein